MKIKITCRSRYNPWLKKYLNTKTFSKILAFGILLNSVPINSFAGILSDDGRYETFEGSNITINDVLEEDKVDVEIEGNTMVNLVKKPSISEQTASTSGLKSIVTVANKASSVQIKPNTMYTVYVEYEIKEITDNCFTYTEGQFNLTDGSYQWFNKMESDNSTGHKRHLFHVYSKEDVESLMLLYIGIGSNNEKNATATIKMNNVLLLEGKYLEDEIPVEYFEGLKSAGEQEDGNHSIEINSQNKNLFDMDDIYNIKGSNNLRKAQDKYIFENNTGTLGSTEYRLTLKPYTTYFMQFKDAVSSTEYNQHVLFGFRLPGKSEQYIRSTNKEGKLITTDGSGILYARFTTENQVHLGYSEFNFIISEGDTSIEYIPFQTEKKEIRFNEPLRGLPSGAKDRIIKRNGQWVVERNCGEITLDGNEGNWNLQEVNEKTMRFYTNSVMPDAILADKIVNPEKSILSSNFVSLTQIMQSSTSDNFDIEGIALRYVNTGVQIRINKNRLVTQDLNGFKQWLKDNPVKVVYQLATPIYEPLNIDLAVNLFKDTTYISNNSTIPATMRVIIDRVANRAKEFSEVAKLNPTSENIARARMWTNLMDESTLKDQFQENISNIIDVSDIALERKSASSNLDIYIKSENMLSMSLDTNTVTFDDYSGTEDIEKLGVVNISINSSLPYSLNAYLATEIANADKSEIIPIDTLNIRESSEGIYKTFANTVDKIVLKDNCNAVNDLMHNIDLKLASSLAHKADVYKTVIKFEAEQK